MSGCLPLLAADLLQSVVFLAKEENRNMEMNLIERLIEIEMRFFQL